VKTSRTALLAATLLVGTPSAEWRYATPDFDWQFPRDHWTHDGFKTEWWYVTGHLRAAGSDAVRFGYQFTFFRVGVLEDTPAMPSAWASANMVMGHAAITDFETGAHRFSEILYRETPFLGGFNAYPDTVIAWSRAPAGTDGTWSISWNGGAFDLAMEDRVTGIGLSLETRPAKPRVFQGPNGYSRKSARDPRNASLYYSFTRLSTTGTVTVDGRARSVVGESWMDKEFGSNQLADDQRGWDWFSLRLEDGRDLMLYRLRNADGTESYRHATMVDADGTARFLADSAWALAPGDGWTSPVTGATYPLEWTVTADILDTPLRVRPQVQHQENVSALVPNLYYWEGAVVLVDGNGASRGRGYLELTGYGAGSRPAI
jgi:predicted secreted hydrolase